MNIPGHAIVDDKRMEVGVLAEEDIKHDRRPVVRFELDQAGFTNQETNSSVSFER